MLTQSSNAAVEDAGEYTTGRKTAGIDRISYSLKAEADAIERARL